MRCVNKVMTDSVACNLITTGDFPFEKVYKLTINELSVGI